MIILKKKKKSCFVRKAARRENRKIVQTTVKRTDGNDVGRAHYSCIDARHAWFGRLFLSNKL